ncbi:hypothetical protein SPI_05512 [Niveomyces insectorum RCEF 264]|uniref:Uncharacterized protein n=1 Tax=Niveomyces insectorum RCEF 264 TaxID=1081102 RepID=A0A167TAE7_9HYPO|nr:hypothetical protein SPI_05512 [Niveomyces insectorum RCEF 264]
MAETPTVPHRLRYLPGIDDYTPRLNPENAASMGNVISSSGDGGGASSEAGTRDADGAYEPTVADVFVVKALLHRSGRLPLELVDAIVDLAGYWPHTTAEVNYGSRNPLVVRSDRLRPLQHENCFLLTGQLRSPPLGFPRRPPGPPDGAYTTARLAPKECAAPYTEEGIRAWLPAGLTAPTLAHPCRKIVFTLVSRDQGWVSTAGAIRGGFKGSYSWFDVGLERYDAEPGDEEFGQDQADEKDKEDGTEKEDKKTDNNDNKNETTTEAPMPSPTDRVRFPPFAALRSVSPAVKQQGGPSVPQFHFPLLPDAHRLQTNRVGDPRWKESTIVWSWTDAHEWQAVQHGDAATAANPDDDALEAQGRGAATGDGQFVRDLRVGDVVTVWAKARFPGWANTVQRVKVDVYWAV